ncbi:hypothetical protein Ssi03_39230 [Sphaerisporangium siamense]|uniref:Uncharacterized protein n=1 Tax=Sphaerisporangium siamense TaxID=795645 RepID=A0A7W7D6C8_9ACTN|nr:DUF6113 family protein [Sphaerisporangium siamense]MBB4700921.1 hypothetical protein [Sphaerisporangium siamense]GII85933.1 hypothetical protein Ssi03_39230 [Sphaerisporangium siamense]
MEEEQVEAPRRPRVPSAIVDGVAYGLLFLFGVAFGVVSGLEHAWPVAGAFAPIPIVLSAVLFVVLYGFGRLMGSRVGAFVPGLGWMFVVLVFSLPRREGDLLIAGNVQGYYYLACGAIAVVAAVLLIPSSGSWLLRERPYGKTGRMNISGEMSA